MARVHYRRRRRSRRSRRARWPGVLTGLVFVGYVFCVGMGDRWARHPGQFLAFVVAFIAACVAVVTVSLLRARSRRRRAEALTRSIAGINELTGAQFEQWVATLMRRTGYSRVRVRGRAGDLGADVTAATPDGRRLVVQCKRHRVDRPVGSPDVQRFAGTAWTVHRAEVAAIVTTSRFTRPARSVAAQAGIGLVDRDALAAWATDDRQPPALNRAARLAIHDPTPGSSRETEIA